MGFFLYNDVMRVTFKELMDALGVGYELSAYETSPWSAYDDEKGITCSAEVRMNNDADEIEAEMQFLRNSPQGDEKPIEQIFWLWARPSTASKWDVLDVKIRNDAVNNTGYDWEGKSCNFFRACVQELVMGNIPDIDDLLAREMKGTEKFGGRSTGGSNKSPKVKTNPALGMKGGMGR